MLKSSGGTTTTSNGPSPKIRKAIWRSPLFAYRVMGSSSGNAIPHEAKRRASPLQPETDGRSGKSVLIKARMNTDSRPNSDYTLGWAPSAQIEYATLADGTRLRYLKAGSGPNLVLVHTVRTQLDHFQLVI